MSVKPPTLKKFAIDFSHFLANYVQKVNQQLLSGQYPLEISGNFQTISCSSKWDGMLCWPPTLLNTTVAIPCNASKIFVETLQETIETVQKELIPGNAYQFCNGSGIWTDVTNYDECVSFLQKCIAIEEDLEEAKRKVRQAVSVITFGLCLASAILLFIALGIFSFFKSLKCDRLRVHKNFMVSLIIRYVVSVIYYEPYIYGDPKAYVWYRGYGFLCKLILALLMYGHVAPVFWMFIEGIYLHSRVATNVLDSQAPFKLYYFIGWFLPLICVLTWAATMEIHINFDTECVEKINATCNENNTCWDGYNELSPAYILFIPMIIALAINLLFLINIVRILVTKLNGEPSTSNQEGAHVRKALRATLILFPLLGITNLLFFINPKNSSHEKIYMLFNASMQSSQGIFLAILYCFLNSEVQEVIRRHWNRFMTKHDIYRRAADGTESTPFKNLCARRETLTVSHDTKRLSKSELNPTEIVPMRQNLDGSYELGSDLASQPHKAKLTANLNGKNVIYCKVELNSIIDNNEDDIV